MYIIRLKKKRRATRGHRFVYRMWYGDEMIYVNRTAQSLAPVFRRHFFAPCKQRPKIDLLQVTKIQYQEFATYADSALYVCYYRNKYKPRLNGGLWQKDRLSINLPLVHWNEWINEQLMARWREEAYLIKTHQKDLLKQRRREWKQQQIKEQQVKVPKFKLKKFNG